LPISPPHLPANMPKPLASEPKDPAPQLMPNQLAEAFALFYEESKKLESQQADLQEKINQVQGITFRLAHLLALSIPH